MLDSLLNLYDHPGWLVLVVVISTFMLEDLAIIGAALLAASGRMAVEDAFCAVVIGIFVGDSALYMIGRLVHVWPWLAKKLANPMIQRQAGPLRGASWKQLALIRCMPGLRTFGYIACGVAKVHSGRFSFANIFSIVIWAGGIFGCAFYLGQQYANSIEQSLWWCLPIALLIFWLGQRKVKSSTGLQYE